MCVKSLHRVYSTNKDEQRKGEIVKQRDVLGGWGGECRKGESPVLPVTEGLGLNDSLNNRATRKRRRRQN